MASAIKSKVSKAASSRSNSDSATKEEAEQYKLFVTAGPSYNQSQHKPVKVNTETPTYIENEFLRAKINVRVRGFRGLPSSSPSTSEYFEHDMHERDQYSLGFSFVPKVNLESLHSVWGNDLDHPVRERLPPGFNTAFRIVKEFIDPGLSCDVYADEPWLYGPSLSCWFALRLGEEIAEGEDFPAPGVLQEGADGSGQRLREGLGLPENNEKRRKFFLSESNREKFVFEKGRLYLADFYNPYLDFANYALKLPGFSLKVIKYIGEKTHCLRYVFKDRQTGNVYFNVNFTLLWGDKLKKALQEDQEAQAEDQAGLNGVVIDHVQAQRSEERDDQDSAGIITEERIASSLQSTAFRPAPSAPMQLHPGDHYAAADAGASDRKDDGIDEIDRLLRETSTKQKREGRVLDGID